MRCLRILARALWLPAALAAAVAIAGCASGGSSKAETGSARGGAFDVVAGENFWGSIAAQLAGDRATVRSIIVDPGVDPHSYQPTAQDARTLAGARMAIVNGLGYDRWMSQLLGADSGQLVLNVGDLLSLHEGDNPHQWYSPPGVIRVVDAIVADYDRLDPSAAPYFADRRRAFLTRGLAEYDRLRTQIRARYAGVPVGYSESIFQPLGQDLGLRLVTPYGFAKAIAEGTDVSAQDKQAVDDLAQRHEIEVWVYNRQNVTPDVQQVTALARMQHIPVATITETLSSPSDSFEQWQVAELRELAAALHQATGR